MITPDQALSQFRQATLPKLTKVRSSTSSIIYRDTKYKIPDAISRIQEEFGDQYPEVAIPVNKMSSFVKEMINSVINPSEECEEEKKTFRAIEWVAELRKKVNPTLINPTEWENLTGLDITEAYSVLQQEEAGKYKAFPKDKQLIMAAADNERQIHLEEEREKLFNMLKYDGSDSNLIEEIVDIFADHDGDQRTRLAYIGALKHFFWGIKNKLRGTDISKKSPLIICFQSPTQSVGKNTLIDTLFKSLGFLYKPDTTLEEISDKFSVRTISAYAVGHLDEFSDHNADVAKVKSFATAFYKGGRGIFSETYRSFRVRVSLVISTNFNIFCQIRDQSGIRRFMPIMVKKSEEAFALFRRLATPEGQEEILQMYRSIDEDSEAPAAPNTPEAIEIARIQEEVVTNATLSPFMEKMGLRMPDILDIVTVLPVNALYEVYSAFCKETKRYHMDPLKFPTALSTARFKVSKSGQVEVIVTQELQGALREAGYRKATFNTKIFEG
jgi:hypothetical protein